MYEAPEVRRLGTVEELTQALNKVGPTPDVFSQVVPIVGSIVTIP
jgi:hypothetical protein